MSEEGFDGLGRPSYRQVWSRDGIGGPSNGEVAWRRSWKTIVRAGVVSGRSWKTVVLLEVPTGESQRLASQAVDDCVESWAGTHRGIGLCFIGMVIATQINRHSLSIVQLANNR